jgi:uncharacterized RDD family membrane protein YckC
VPYCKNCGNELLPDARYCPRCGAAAMPQTLTEPSAPSGLQLPAGLRLAFWGERFVAWLIDIIILGVIVGILELLTPVIWQPYPYVPTWLPLFNFGTSSLIYFLYWMLMEGAYGQSLGKMLMHLRVVRLDGRPIDMGQAALESVGKAFLLILDFLIGLFAYPNRRQRIFNYLSGTVVVRER